LSVNQAPGSYQFQVVSTKDVDAILIPGAGTSNAQEDEGLGTFSVKLQVNDLKGGVSFQKYQIRLHPEEGNSAPVIISEAVVKGFTNRVYTYDVEAVDADNDALLYSIVDAPVGMIIDSESGKISWYSPVVGVHEIKVRVMDTSGGLETQIFTITISDVGNGRVQGIVYDDLDKNGARKITNPNNLDPYLGVEIGDRFKTNYTPYSLGLPNGLPGPVGPMVFLPGDPDTILIGGGIASCGGSIYKVKVLRGEGGHIIGFDDDADPDTPYVAEFYQYAPYLSGMTYAPDGSLITTNSKSSPYAGIGFVPDYVSGAGALKSTGRWPNTGFYTQSYLGNGQFNNAVQSGLVEPGSGSFVYRPNTARNFQAGSEILINDPVGDQVFAYEIDNAGNPIAGTQDVFLKDLDLVAGVVVDPVTGDILFSAAGSELSNSANTILAVRGLGPIAGSEPGLADRKVYVDRDQDGVRDLGEEHTTTDANGHYSFILAAGTYQIRQELERGWTQTSPIDPIYRTVTVVSNKTVYDVDFGNFGAPVTADNVAPEITSEPILEAVSGERYLYKVEASDLNNDALTYELVLKPEGMAIAPNDTIFWRPESEQLGSNRVVVRVTDVEGAINLQTFDVVVKQGNSAPLVTSKLPDYNPQVGKEFQYQVVAIDPDGNTLSYQLLSNPYQPVGVTINAQTGLVKWTPTAAQIGGVSVYGDYNELVAPWQVTVKVSDGKGKETYQSLDLIVDAAQVNQAPVIVSSPRTTVQSGTTYFYAVGATDVNGDRLTYSLENAPTGMTIKDGIITWTPTAAQTGGTPVVVKVSDGTTTTTQVFTPEVVSKAPNYAPQITSVPTLGTNLERPYVYNLQGKDSDGDLLLWSLDQAPVGMAIDAQTGALRWQPTAEQIGEHFVAVRLMDNFGAFTVQEFTVKVTGTNVPPNIASVPPTKAAIGQLYNYSVVATDPENDVLRYVLAKHPTGMLINGVTGQIAWTPVANQLGSQEVEVQVIDAQGAVSSQLYRIEVGNKAINLAPTISSNPSGRADVGIPYQYQVVAKDPENGTLTYGLKNAPAGMVIDSVTGLVTWANPVVGSYQVVVTVADSEGLGVEQGYTLVSRQNAVPTISSNPKLTTIVNAPYRYDLVAKDNDGDQLSYKLDQGSLARGMTIDQNGRIAWKPGSTEIGVHPVTITVSDGLQAVTQTYSLEVLADVVAPLVQVLSSSNFAEIGETLTFQVAATDNVGVKSQQLLVNNQAVALDGNGSGTYVVTVPGVVNIQAIVTDANGNVSTSNTTVNVIDPTDAEAPVVNVTFPSTNITGLTDIIGSVTDTNLDYYVLEVALAGTENYKEVFRGTSNVTNGLLGKFDPSGLSNDTYTLRLTAFDVNGKGTQIDQDVAVASELKLGNFRLSFTDIALPVAGVPITLTRTYDTLTANNKDDFGYGWRMEFRDTDLRTSLKRDVLYEELGYFRTVGFQDGDRVYITLPGGKREGFTFRAVKAAGKEDDIAALNIGFLRANFDADKGNTSKLAIPNNTFSFGLYGDGTNSNGDGSNANGLLTRDANGKLVNLAGLPYRPDEQVFGNRYLLTTKDGTVYEINATTGDLESVKDTNGNKLTYSDTEIVSSTGQKVVFERDNQGRIVSVIDPLGAKIKYEYDAQGDLVGVTDRDGNTTRYQYNSAQQHYLDKIIDPLGREAVKTEYDAQGRLKKTTNATGNGVEFIYDPANSIEVVKDALGNATTYEYDVRGNIVTEIDAVGKVVKRIFDEENNVLSETVISDRSGNAGFTTRYTYDQKRNKLTETDTLGNTKYYSYNSRGQTLSETDALGNTTRYGYDGRGNLVSKTDALNQTTTYVYDGRGNLLSITESNNRISRFEYDRAGNRIKEVDPLGHVKEYAYDSNGNVTKLTTYLTTANGLQTITTRKTYNSNNQVTSLIDNQGNITKFEYDVNQNQTAVVDAANRRTEYRYNDSNQIIETIYPDDTPNDSTDNIRLKTNYDAANNKTAIVDQLGRINLFKYDAIGRGTEVIYPDNTPDNLTDNQRVINQYNQLGEVTSSTNNLDITTNFHYDALGKTTLVRNFYRGHNVDTSTSYDAIGRKISTTDALGHTTKYVYDALSRVIQTTYANGSTEKVTYDQFGNIITKTNQLNISTRYEYDALNQLTATIDALNHRTEYKYNELGKLTQQKDANGNITKYEYDTLGQLTALIRPMGQKQTMTHDTLGRISSITDFNGQTTNYEYDTYDHLKRKYFVQTGKSVELKFSPLGKIEQTTDENGTTIYNYNSQERLISQLNPDGTSIRYTYDTSGQLIRVATPSNTVSYSYDELARLSTVVSTDGTTNYSYNDLGNLTTTKLANGVVESRSYDVLNRLISVTNSNSTGNIISQYDYILDALGNKTKVIELNGRQLEYKYDDLMRLTNEKIIDPINGSRTIDYVYDSVGNRVSRNDSVNGLSLYTYNANDHLINEYNQGVNTNYTNYTYDNNGNNIKIESSNQNIQYGWDSENRLTSVDTQNSFGVQNIKYNYDFNGNRIATIENGVETRYLVDTNRYYAQVLEEYQSNGQIHASYVYGLDLISKHQSNSMFYLRDGFSGIRQLTNVAGQVIDSYTYDAYGRILSFTGNTDNNYGYQNQQSDDNTGLQYLRARYYNPNLGRFTSTDPREGSLDYPVSRHRYLYANDNPLTFFDPSGESSVFAAPALSSIISSIATPTLGLNVLNAAIGLSGAFAAATAAILTYSKWRNLNRGNKFDGVFELLKIPAYGVPGTPSYALGYARLSSASNQVNVATVGRSFTVTDLNPIKLPTLKPSTYTAEVFAPGTSTSSFIGPFVFSNLRFTFPGLLPDGITADGKSGALLLGLSAGTAVSKPKQLPTSFGIEALRYDPFEAGIVVGVAF
jgi:RHS repeat-associated protein